MKDRYEILDMDVILFADGDPVVNSYPGEDMPIEANVTKI